MRLYRLFVCVLILFGATTTSQAGNWWLIAVDCQEDHTTICCCGGVSTICEVPGMKFHCYFNGLYDCTSDLGICESSPANCIYCCIPCGYDGPLPDCPTCPREIRA